VKIASARHQDLRVLILFAGAILTLALLSPFNAHGYQKGV
jgi:hypothetical protein